MSAKSRRKAKAMAAIQQGLGTVRITAGYDATVWSRNRSTITHAVQDATKDLTPHVLRELRKHSRYLYCNSAVYSGAVKRLVTLIVGTGIMSTSASATPEWAKRATAEYALWSKRCDITRVDQMPARQQAIVRAMIVDGECFDLKTNDEIDGQESLQLLEAHQIEDIICTDVGRPIYYVPAGAKKVKEGEVSPDWYPADKVIHYFRKERPGQRRGVPLFAAAINTARDVDEIINIEKAASKAAGKTVEVINRKGGQMPTRARRIGEAATTSDPSRPDSYFQQVVGPEGLVLDIDEKYEQVVSQRPSTAWQGFIDFLLGIFCLAGDMPPSAFLQLKVGGADTRRDLASAQRVIEQWQQLVACGQQQAWDYFVENSKALEPGRPADWRNVTHQFPRKLTVDDGRTSAQDRADIASGATTVDEYCGMYGASGTAHVAALRAEMLEINPALTPEQVNTMLVKRLFGVDAPAAKAAPVTDTGAGNADQKSLAEAGDLQSAALNGAQVTALVEIALKVATGELPRESAMAIARAAFPTVSAEIIASIFDITPKPPVAPKEPPAAV